MANIISKINGTTYNIAIPVCDSKEELEKRGGRNGELVWCEGDCYVYNNGWRLFVKPDTYMDSSSGNSVQNKVVYTYINNICSNFVTTYTGDTRYFMKGVIAMTKQEYETLSDDKKKNVYVFFLTND